MHDSHQILSLAEQAGFELVGICDATIELNLAQYEKWLEKGFHGEMQYLARHLVQKRNPASLLPNAQSILAVGLNYFQEASPQPGMARLARYSLGRDYHKVVRSKLKRIAVQLQQTYTDLHFRICVDSAPILERDFAKAAGLGWYGKNTMLINSQKGSWFVIGLLMLDQRFQPSEPAIGGCGTCTRCIDACPTGAIVSNEETWTIDARNCISYRTIELKGQLPSNELHPIQDWTFGCDICQEVCPFNQQRETQPARAQFTNEADFQKRIEPKRLDQVVSMEFSEWDLWTRGSPVRRAGYEGIRRNANANLAWLRAQGEALPPEK